MTESPTFRLVYRSHSRIPAEERATALAEIFDAARANNRRAGVTGALLITDHYFVQALEGEQEQVRTLFERIRADGRHAEVTVIAEDDGVPHVFHRWTMARVSADGGADIPLHVTSTGVHAAARNPVTREEAALLKSMRNTIGADVV